jgi:hypothetical protein
MDHRLHTGRNVRMHANPDHADDRRPEAGSLVGLGSGDRSTQDVGHDLADQVAL